MLCLETRCARAVGCDVMVHANPCSALCCALGYALDCRAHGDGALRRAGGLSGFTDAPLDLDSPAHLDALKRAYERFPEIGGRSIP